MRATIRELVRVLQKAGEEPGSQKAFAGELGKRGFEKHRHGKGRGFKGVRIKLQVTSSIVAGMSPID